MYEKMDANMEVLNAGLTRLMVMALVRATCQRPGAMGKDLFDLANKTVWGPEGQNVLSVKDISWSRTGMDITMFDGTIEKGASRGEIKYNRLKHRYFEAAAGGYEYHMSLTPDAEAVMRRSADIVMSDDVLVAAWGDTNNTDKTNTHLHMLYTKSPSGITILFIHTTH